MTLIPPIPLPSKSNLKPKRWLFLAITGILLIILIGGVILIGIYIRQSKEKKEKGVASTETINTTADWKTYTNDELGISFKYPLSWIKAGADNNEPEWLKNGTYLYLKSTTQDYPNKNFPLDGLISVSTLNNPEKVFLQEIFNKDYQKCLKSEEEDPGMGCAGPMDTSKWKRMIIDGREALRSGRSGRPESVPMDEVYINLGNEYLIIGLSYYNYLDNDISSEMASDFDKILSTFKFTNSTNEETNDEQKIINLLDKFEQALIKKNAQTIFNLYTEPKNTTEQDQFDFLQGKDINNQVRLFTTRGAGTLVKYVSYDLDKVYKSNLDYVAEVIEKKQDYDDETAKWLDTIREERYYVRFKKINNEWKIDKFYKEGTKEEDQKYDTYFAN